MSQTGAVARGDSLPGRGGMLFVVDLFAVLIELLVELLLFGLGQVTAVGLYVRPLLSFDRGVVLAQLLGLLLRELAALEPLIDALVLVLDALIDLCSPGMIFLELAFLVLVLVVRMGGCG